MKYLSLFSGIGGFELGIGPEHECVGYSEIDQHAVSIYKRHFPNHQNYGDITAIDAPRLPDFDLLVGGFPCQSFSIAGKRRGFSDTRGTLFFDIARILKAKRPRLLLLENVKGLLSHDEGQTFGTILRTLDELGYDLQWQVLNSKDHGVPQNRERVFIVGHLRGTRRPQVFPFPASDEADHELRDAGGEDDGWDGQGTERRPAERRDIRGSHDDDENRALVGARDVHIRQRPRGKNKGGRHQEAPALTGKSYADNNHVAYTLRARHDSGISRKHPQNLVEGRARMIARNQRGEVREMPVSGALTKERSGSQFSYLRIPEATKKGHAEARVGDSINLSVMGSKTRRGRVGAGIAQTLDTGMQQYTIASTLDASYHKGDNRPGNKSNRTKIYGPGTIRRLTPVECERLQGFPDGWTALGTDCGDCHILHPEARRWECPHTYEVSDTQRYKCCGNAVTVNVIRDIIQRLCS